MCKPKINEWDYNYWRTQIHYELATKIILKIIAVKNIQLVDEELRLIGSHYPYIGQIWFTARYRIELIARRVSLQINPNETTHSTFYNSFKQKIDECLTLPYLFSSKHSREEVHANRNDICEVAELVELIDTHLSDILS